MQITHICQPVSENTASMRGLPLSLSDFLMALLTTFDTLALQQSTDSAHGESPRSFCCSDLTHVLALSATACHFKQHDHTAPHSALVSLRKMSPSVTHITRKSPSSARGQLYPLGGLFQHSGEAVSHHLEFIIVF